MIILAIGFAIIAYHQYSLLKKSKGSSRDRWISYLVTGVVLVYGVLCVLNPREVSPNKPIRFVFEPVQDWLLHISPPSDTSR